MKQTIVTKIKRFALALFAALCVGNVWAGYLSFDVDKFTMSEVGNSIIDFNSETLELSVSRDIYTRVNAKKWEMKFVYQYESTSKESICVTNTYAMTGVPAGGWTSGVGETFVLNDFSVGKVLNVECWFEYGGVRITDGGDAENYLVLVFDTRGVLTSDCTWDVDTKNFILSGKAAGYGITGVKVKYKVSDAELAELTELPQDAVVQDAEYDSATGVYNIEIPYVNEKSYLYWSVYAVFDDGEKIFNDPASQKSVLSERQDEDGYIAYTWVGSDENNLWSSPENWDENLKRSLKGVPGYVNYAGHYTSIACFTNSATVNLGGGTYRLYDYEGNNIPHRALRFIKGDNENMVVKFTNGNLQINDGEENNSNPLLGADGVTVEFADGCIYKYPYQLAFAPGTTIIFSGDSNQPWKYNPASKGEGATTFIVRNGNVKSYYGAESVSQTHTAIIENGVWMIDEVVSKGIANVTKFVDGANQARIVCGSTTTGASKELKLTDTFEFKFTEETNWTMPYIWAVQLAADSCCIFKVDVTDCHKKLRIPLLCVNNLTDNTKNSINTILANPDLLQVVENGRSVKSNRRGELVWDEATKTLYYEQDPVKGFRVIVR